MAFPDAEKSRVVLLHKLAGIPAKAMAKLLNDRAADRKIGRTKLAQLSQLLNFLYEENTLTENKMPQLKKYGYPTFHGPASEFLNLRWNEFMVADQYHSAFVRTSCLSMLDYLLSAIYRFKRPDYDPDKHDDIREPFNQHVLKRRALIWKKVAIHHKLSLYYFYVGCRAELVRTYPDIFDSGGEGQTAGQSGQTADWLDLLRHLPSDKFGTLEQLENQYVHTTLELASRMMRDARKVNSHQSTVHRQ